ncbi:MAG: cation transporter [Clostridia bacterium]|nr:cation transporter [Clostridia bacterium]
MKTERNILIAFILNLAFSIFELFGGLFTGSVAILSDAVHDVGDAASIGISYMLERKSRQKPDDDFTYGYARYSVIGSVITTLILLVGSALVIVHAIEKILSPTAIHSNGMILLAVIGIAVNIAAALVTREGDSLNQKAVNLHMLEDVLGWAVVLVGAIVIRLTDLVIIDPLMSIGVALFVFFSAVKNLKQAVDVFLEKTPHGIAVEDIRQHIGAINGVADVHHMHVWSMDGQSHYATMHIVTDAPAATIKEQVRQELAEHGIVHATLELERTDERCEETCCHPTAPHDGHRHHHHHHHH